MAWLSVECLINVFSMICIFLYSGRIIFYLEKNYCLLFKINIFQFTKFWRQHTNNWYCLIYDFYNRFSHAIQCQIRDLKVLKAQNPVLLKCIGIKIHSHYIVIKILIAIFFFKYKYVSFNKVLKLRILLNVNIFDLIFWFSNTNSWSHIELTNPLWWF